MEFLDSVFKVIFFLFALLGLAAAAYGVYMIVIGVRKFRQPPLVEPVAIRLMGGVLIAAGLEMFFINARISFIGEDIEMNYWTTASAFLLFFMVMGIATILGRPFLAANLIPKLTSRRVLLGVSFIICGFLCFFKLSEDYWPVPENIQDLIFWAIFFILLSSPVLISRLRRQAN